MEDTKKGTVTSLSSLFPVEEAQKAANRVQHAIAEKHKELDTVRGFISDNKNLINLVQKLPEELSHDIMVPFGKAAFFPGRLIHTNEFLVLLGDGYYAERSSKQTVDILNRRGSALDSQADSLVAMLKDLEAEASFFNATASEAGEGLVEIREDYVEEDSTESESKSGPPKQDSLDSGKGRGDDDDDYAQMMSRLDELEKEELAAENGNRSDQDDETTAGFADISSQRSIDTDLHNSKDFHRSITQDQTNNQSIGTEFPKRHNHQEDLADQLNFSSLAVQSKLREEKSIAQNVKTIDHRKKLPLHPEEKIVQTTTTTKSEVPHRTSQPLYDSCKDFTGSIIEHAENLKSTSREQSSTSSQVPHRPSQPLFDSRKAFTGSIIEHAENLKPISREQSSTSQVSGSQTSKPVSRFKMQRK